MAKEQTEPLTFHSNFGLIERIDVPRKQSISAFALQTQPQLPSTQSAPTPPSAKRRWARAERVEQDVSQTPETDSNDEDGLSEEEIRQMLFGEDTFEEEEAVEESSEKKQWVPSLSYKLGFGYSDNPMYGPYVREESGYAEMESEVFEMRKKCDACVPEKKAASSK